MHRRIFILVSLAFLGATSVSSAALADTKNVVLVHGLSVDGSSWRPVYDIRTGQGYNVSIVQAPLNGFDNDVHAAPLVLNRQVGPVVFVGHSYGGVVTTAVGNDPKVEALVFIAAFQPATGETTGSLNAERPRLLDPTAIVASEEGHITISEQGFLIDVAPDLPTEEARFLFSSQASTIASVVPAEAGDDPAWQHKPSCARVATNDRVINPDLQRSMSTRAGSIVTEVNAGHMLCLSHPQAMAKGIIEAARSR